jgi:hypothetical protein
MFGVVAVCREQRPEAAYRGVWASVYRDLLVLRRLEAG